MLDAETINPDISQADTSEAAPEQRESRALVKSWLERISNASEHWSKDFKRMKENMEFCSGIQWAGQETIDTDRYVVPLTLRLVNQKVSTIYAKNPTVVATPRKRKHYQIWDGKMDSFVEASEMAAMTQAMGMPLPPQLEAFFMDIEMGRNREQAIEGVGETLEILFQYTFDSQKPEFKEQMKQAVVRACVCGVAYARPVLCKKDEARATSMLPNGTLEARAQTLLNKLDETPDDDVTLASLRSMTYALGATPEIEGPNETLEFDFPPTTSIIVDPRCRNLTDFVAARWIAQEYVLPVDEVNALFGSDIKLNSKGGGADEYNVRNDTKLPDPDVNSDDTDLAKKKLVKVYEVFDYTTKTRFFICQGHPDFLSEPEPPFPAVRGFWHHFALVLNRTEVEPGCKISLFPPSDVQTIKSAQLEWNRTRDALRDHRNANAPKYVARKGILTDNDKRNLTQATPNTVIELEGIPPDMPLEKALIALQVVAINPTLYDVAPLEQDIYMGGGMQQANLGPAQPNVTATVGNIAEQSRMSVSSSNVDDLDGFLSRIVQAGGEMKLQGFSRETVVEIAGPGAIWPSDEASRQGFLKEVFLKIEAASSGRPNKAMEIANWSQLAPLLAQAGANPVGMIKETAKRLDENLRVEEFLPPMIGAGGGMGGPMGPQGGPPGEEVEGEGQSAPTPDTEAVPSGPGVPPI